MAGNQNLGVLWAWLELAALIVLYWGALRCLYALIRQFKALTSHRERQLRRILLVQGIVPAILSVLDLVNNIVACAPDVQGNTLLDFALVVFFWPLLITAGLPFAVEWVGTHPYHC